MRALFILNKGKWVCCSLFIHYNRVLPLPVILKWKGTSLTVCNWMEERTKWKTQGSAWFFSLSFAHSPFISFLFSLGSFHAFSSLHCKRTKEGEKRDEWCCEEDYEEKNVSEEWPHGSLFISSHTKQFITLHFLL